MGYTTDFDGEIFIDPPLNEHEISFLGDLANTRRMKRINGPLFVGGQGFAGQDHEVDVTDYNNPDPSQPGLWLQWVPYDDGTALVWDQTEKFDHSAEWMKYLVTNLLATSATFYIAQHVDEDDRLQHFTCDHILNGEITAQGEDYDDSWKLVVTDNNVGVARSVSEYGPVTPI